MVAAGVLAGGVTSDVAGAAKPVAASSAQRRLASEVSASERFLMGTAVHVEAYGGAAAARQTAIDESYAAMAEVDRVMSTYRDDSELSRVNREAARSAVPVSAPLWRVLEAAQLLNDRSRGAYDMTIGPALALWGFPSRAPRVPAPSEIAHVRPLVNGTNVVLERAEQSVRFTRAGVALDLGGLAKGFAVELAAGVLRRHGMSGYIDAGGTQYLLGRPPGRAAWRVGIEDPDRPADMLGVLEIDEGAVSMAGGSRQMFALEGHRYSYVLDPRTLRPADNALSVVVVSRDATMADGLAEPALALGARAGLDLVESFPGTAAVIVYRDATHRVALAMSESLRVRFRRVAPSAAP